MKRFRWSLQRVLDVTRQRELAWRAELLRISRALARVRQEILRRRRTILVSVGELANQDVGKRIPRQEVVMACSAGLAKEIDRLEAELGALNRQRKDKTAQFVKTRNSRETLERMREEARQAHLRGELKLEQKELDEAAHVSFAHNVREGRGAEGELGA